MLSQKQSDFFESELSRMTIIDGCVSSGKTFIANHKAIKHLAQNYQNKGLVMFIGRTLGTLEKNVLLPIQSQFGTDYFKYSIHQKKADLCGIRIDLEGCNDISAETKIRGTTAEFIYGDEITLWNLPFLLRCMASLRTPGASFVGTTNPDSIKNFVYTEFLQKQKELGLTHLSFNMDDNPSIEKEYRDFISKSYTGVLHDRFIKGKWVRAEGLIYDYFANHQSEFLIDKIKDSIMYVSIGLDYGANKSKTKFVATGFTPGYKKVIIIDEDEMTGIHDPDSIYERFYQFYLRLVKQGYNVKYVFADYGALGQIITDGLQYFCKRNKLPVMIEDCQKGTILDRIIITMRMQATHILQIHESCKVIVEAFADAVWDDKQDNERLDDGTTDIDSLDAFEYSIWPFADYINRNFLYGG